MAVGGGFPAEGFPISRAMKPRDVAVMLRRAYVVVGPFQEYAGRRDEPGDEIARRRAIESDGLKRYKVIGCNAKPGTNVPGPDRGRFVGFKSQNGL